MYGYACGLPKESSCSTSILCNFRLLLCANCCFLVSPARARPPFYAPSPTVALPLSRFVFDSLLQGFPLTTLFDSAPCIFYCASIGWDLSWPRFILLCTALHAPSAQKKSGKNNHGLGRGLPPHNLVPRNGMLDNFLWGKSLSGDKMSPETQCGHSGVLPAPFQMAPN